MNRDIIFEEQEDRETTIDPKNKGYFPPLQ